uniref:probable E3 ubiquitin-protein ligase RNF217 isoform X3 n=1 Tax=Solea senegalensis TaxID=28829 RepID=UPI001CD905CB|nr:probable E3 ubiquitin-protein ligase RNF217 isoform X3 [Solea senegalensis]
MFSKCVAELKMKNNPKDKTLMFVGRKGDLDLFSRCVEELKMKNNPTDKTPTFVDRKDGPNLTQRVKEPRKIHNPKDKTLTFVDRNNKHQREVVTIQVQIGKELKKMHDPKDNTLTFVDKEEDLDPVSSDDGCLKGLMSCGHAVTPETLTGWCRSRLDEGDYKFTCPALVNGTKKCNKLWSYQEVRRLADLSPEEMQDFEMTMAHLAVTSYCETQPCPHCKTYVERTDLSNLCVTCTICAADDPTYSLFCWQCQKPWKGVAPQRYRCGNSGCVNKDLQILKSCRTISLPEVRGATNCPSVRACPTCGLKVEHNQQHCKNVTCPRCQAVFCFICLQRKRKCSKTSTPFQMCVSGVAPRQTSIPIWHRR